MKSLIPSTPAAPSGDGATAEAEISKPFRARENEDAKEVKAQAEAIVAAAKTDATNSAEAAKEDIRRSVERRLRTATEQIAAAEAAAIRQIKDRAVGVAVAAAGDVIRGRVKAEQANALIDASISEVGAKLH